MGDRVQNRFSSVAFIAVMALFIAAHSVAEIPPGDLTIELETVATGLTAPLGVTHAGDGSGRLFIWEQSGQIRIVEDDQLLPTPFLDISGKLPPLNPFFDERALLGLAFHPRFEHSGGITVIGGYVYRGPRSPDLRGTYVFGNFPDQFVVPSGRLYYLVESPAAGFEIRQFRIGAGDRPNGLFLKRFGEDEKGEL